MKRLLFILLSIFIISLEVYGKDYTLSLLSNTKYETPFNFNNIDIFIRNNKFAQKTMYDSCTTNYTITIKTNDIDPTNITNVNETDCFNVNYYINDTLKLTYQINNTDINFAYTCADGYTNQYNQDKTFKYGCFTDTKECTTNNLKDCIVDTTNYTYLNIDTNNFEEILNTINFSTSEDAYLVKDNNNIYTLYFYKPLKTECCFNNDNILNKGNINTTYECPTDTKAKIKEGFTTLFTDKFAPCSKITAQVNKADCEDIKDENIIADTKTCYGGPKDNFYVEGNEIKECPVIASTTNHNYDDSAYTDDKDTNINRKNPNWSKFDTSSCKFYGKKHTNKTGFCDSGGQNCIYFENDYKIEEITICNANKGCKKPQK